MEINGIERGFCYTVGASIDIAKICPGGNAARMNEVLQGEDSSAALLFIARHACILNKWYEKQREFEGLEHHDPLTVDEVLLLSPIQFMELRQAINEAYKQSKGEMELKPSKKN